MRKPIFTTLLLIFSIILHSKAQDQNPIQLNNTTTTGERIINFNSAYNFSHCMMYDISLKRTYNQSYCDAVIGINIDANGVGSLSFFLMQKVKFKINSCTLSGGQYIFDLTKSNGEPTRAVMSVKANYITSFSISVDNDDIYIVLSN